VQLVLQGQIITPIITKKSRFYVKGCIATIINPRRRYFSKIVANKPMFPYSLICYSGKIELQYSCSSLTKAKRKLLKLLNIKSIGRFSSEGLGRIKWLKGIIDNYTIISDKKKKKRKLKIRKGLPHLIPTNVQKLIQYALLHGFFHTPRHKSKIYVEPEIDDLELSESLRCHHDKLDDPIIINFQKYDRIAASITRKYRSPRTNRYNWYSIENVNFKKIAKEITEVHDNIWRLYQYIYDSNELDKLNESLEHGYTSIKKHLLIITNLIVHEFLQTREPTMYNKRDKLPLPDT
jgi:hypothetical protein